MKAFILAAGFGTRMKELTKEIPKPLLKVNGKTLLEHSIDFLKELGVGEFIFNTHYLAEKIHSYLKKRADINYQISYEEKILGTAGGIFFALHNSIPEKIILLNPDMIYKPKDIKNLKSQIQNANEDLTLFISQKQNDDNTSLDFKNGKVYFQDGDFTYIGLAVLNTKILAGLKLNEFHDLSQIFRELSYTNKLNGIIFEGQVIDLGDKQKYLDFIS